MDIEKFSHACVRIRSGNRSLVLDPGTFSPVARALDGVEAVLVTHEHADHLDLPALLEVMKSNTSLSVHAPAVLAGRVLEAAREADVPGAAGRVHAVAVDARLQIAGMSVSTHGGLHAKIHSSLPQVANLGYFIGGRIYHPGDSYHVPAGLDVQALLVPAHAPWAKIGETIDFLAAVGAAQNFPIHDGLLNDRGLAMMDGHLTRVANEHGLSYRRPAEGEIVTLEA